MSDKKPLQRTDILDTRLSAHRRQIVLLRNMLPEEKLKLSFEMIESARAIKRCAEDYERSRSRRGV